MIFSRDRILTTHVGSLRATKNCPDLLVRQEAGEKFDAKELASEMDKAVTHVVGKQVSAGIDIGNDGEQHGSASRPMCRSACPASAACRTPAGKEFEEFPELVESLKRRFPHVSKQQNARNAKAS